MSSLEDEILEIENYIKTLEINDNTNKEVEDMIKDGMSKGLIYDFFNPRNLYRGTIFSTKVKSNQIYSEFINMFI